MSKYVAPNLPADCLPAVQAQIDELTAKRDQAKHEGYALWSKARAQQAAAESATDPNYANLLMAGGQGIVGVRQLDVMAQGRWAEVAQYQAMLDKLKAEQEAVKKAAG